jgi:hemoglobin-like flavoprotein
MPADVGLIRSLEASFDLVLERCPEFGARFYERLFTSFPNLRAMFPTDMKAQEKKLTDTLGFVIHSLRDPPTLQQSFRVLGERHAAMGVRREQYAPVIACLVRTMAEALGNDWTDELQADWLQALRLVAEAMTSVSTPGTTTTPR